MTFNARTVCVRESHVDSAVNMNIHWSLINVIVGASLVLISIWTQWHLSFAVLLNTWPHLLSLITRSQLAWAAFFGILRFLSNFRQPESTLFPPSKHDISDTFDISEIKRSCLKSSCKVAGRCNRSVPFFSIMESKKKKKGREKDLKIFVTLTHREHFNLFSRTRHLKHTSFCFECQIFYFFSCNTWKKKKKIGSFTQKWSEI